MLDYSELSAVIAIIIIVPTPLGSASLPREFTRRNEAQN